MVKSVNLKSPIPRLEMCGINKSFGATTAIKKVDFSLLNGEIHALVGENGAGKSTLMKILSGAHKPDEGDMLIDGVPYCPRGPLEARKKGVSMIYQELSLAPHMTVEENILLGMEPKKCGFVRRRKVRQLALSALEQFAYQEIKPDSLVMDLSVGSQQLVEIGRALAVGCQVLVLDEPTSSLSQKDIENLFQVIRGLKKSGISIIYISHFLEEVEKIADRLTVLRDGSLINTLNIGEVSTNEIVTMMVGRKVKDLYPRSPRKKSECVLEISHLSGQSKPEDASLTLHRGEILGICGLVGAGRTELLRIIFGLDKLKSGKIKIGVFTGPASPARRWMQDVGMLSENRNEEGLILNMTIADNITLSNLKSFGPFGLVLPGKQHKATDKWIAEMDIRCQNAEQTVGNLSGGNQQKVALARLLQHDVDILLLDEPTRGIDVAAKANIYEVIDNLVSISEKSIRKPRAILIISSYMPELMGVCDKIAVMSRGRLSEVKKINDVDEHKLIMAATGQEEL